MSNKSTGWFSTIFSIGIVLGSGIGYGFRFYVPEKQPSTIAQQREVGFAEFVRLQPGMALSEVESILDRGIEIERSETTATYTWRNVSGSSITAIFRNGKLDRKTQINLK